MVLFGAIATLYFAYAKYSQNSEAITGEYFLVAATIGIYIAAVAGQILATEIEQLSKIVLNAANDSKTLKSIVEPEE
ncbi:MAG: hypothetical protein QNJ32_09255 [Xenococcaceae cyanobacterium MO_167.B27]|nr:hypothetical protein [Xenococcaceae cyanobacterium MO_167.B27]